MTHNVDPKAIARVTRLKSNGAILKMISKAHARAKGDRWPIALVIDDNRFRVLLDNGTMADVEDHELDGLLAAVNAVAR